MQMAKAVSVTAAAGATLQAGTRAPSLAASATTSLLQQHQPQHRKDFHGEASRWTEGMAAVAPREPISLTKVGTAYSSNSAAGEDGACKGTCTTATVAAQQSLLAQQQVKLQQLLAQQASNLQQQQTLLQQHALSSRLPAQTAQQLQQHQKHQHQHQQQHQMAFMPCTRFDPPFQGGLGTATNAGMSHLMQTPQGAVWNSSAPFQEGALLMPGASSGFASMPPALASASYPW
jgi:hypothetical protein